MIVVDTSILIDHLRGDPRASTILRDAIRRRERLVGSVLTRVEVLAGTRTGEEAVTLSLFSLLEWVPVNETLADHAGKLARQYVRSHPGVDPVDFVIAATVEHLHAGLWTRNRKHFPMFPALTDPYAD